MEKTIIAAMLLVMIAIGIGSKTYNTNLAHQHYLERRTADYVEFVSGRE